MFSNFVLNYWICCRICYHLAFSKPRVRGQLSSHIFVGKFVKFVLWYSNKWLLSQRATADKVSTLSPYLQLSFLEPPPPQRAWWQQKMTPHELKKQQKRSMVMSTIKMTAMTMPAIAPAPSPTSVRAPTSGSSTRRQTEPKHFLLCCVEHLHTGHPTHSADFSKPHNNQSYCTL